MAALRRRDIGLRTETLARRLQTIRSETAHLLPWSLTLFCLSAAAAVAFVAYLTMAVPVDIPTLPRDEARNHWPIAAVAAVLVLGAGAAVLATSLNRTRRPAVESDVSPRPGYISWPSALHLQTVPRWLVYITALASAASLTAAIIEDFPEWGIVLAFLVPWLPAAAIEGTSKYRQYGTFAFFLMVSLLQTGHLGEHAAQVTQLLMNDGDLSHSHGVFGQLDFETVHFFWDSAIWLTVCLVLLSSWRNGWLLASFVFASLHEAEHAYLYWLFLSDYDYYMRGGLAGIMGKGGVIGSPLARPYLHFLYNFFVTATMLIALWTQARRMDQHAPPSERKTAL